MRRNLLLLSLSWFLVYAATCDTARAQGNVTEQRLVWFSNNRIEVKGTLGHASFVDDSLIPHFLVGGSVRFRLIGGLGFEPELTYMWSERCHDLVLMPNLVYEFRRGHRVVPYFIGGIGLLHHSTERWGIKWSGNARYISAGFGAKVFLSPRIFIAPEVRLGWEPSLRAGGTIGYVFKR